MFRNIALVGDGTTKLSCINFLNRNSVTKNNMWKRQTTVFYQNIQPTTNLGLIFFDNINQHKIEQHIKDLKNVDADYLIMWPHNQDEQWLNCKKGNIVFLPKEINWGLILSTLPPSKRWL